MMKHFYPDGSGLFQDDNAPIHRAQGVSEWSEEYENDVNHILRPPQILAPFLREIWTDMLDSALHHHHQNTK